MVKIKVVNIGGIEEPLEIELRKGINRILAPNAAGKTSLVRAIESILHDRIREDHLLNLGANEGLVELEYNERKYFRKLAKTSYGTVVTYDKKLLLNDERVQLVSIATPENELIRSIEAGNEDVRWFISRVSGAEKLREKIEKLERERIRIEEELSELYAESRKARELEKERSKLLRRKKELEEELKKLPEIDLTVEEKLFKEIDERYKSLKDRIESLKSKMEKNRKEKEEKERELKEKKALLEDILKKHPNIREEIDMLEREIRELIAKSQRIAQDLNFYIKTKEHIEEDIKRGVTKCPVCGYNIPSVEYWKRRLLDVEKEIKKIKAELDKVENTITELENKKRELRDMEENVRELKESIERIRGELIGLDKTISEFEAELKDLEKELREVAKRREELRSKIEKKKREVIEKRNKVKAELNRIIKDLEDVDKELERIGDMESRIAEDEEKIREIEDELSHLRNEYEKLLHAARSEFNSIVKKVLSEMGFKYFTLVEINPEFKLIVKSVRKGKEVIQPLETLSSSEKKALALLLLVAAHRHYLPNNPFFIVDETILSFDPTTKEVILKYLKGRTDYIIVTDLLPSASGRRIVIKTE